MVATPLFTVFTPTFNRAHTLHRVYDSLAAQTCRNFEWMIVDDGSTDQTEQLIERWLVENKINIRYFKQENHGKHHAFNCGVNLARGELFVPIDSDDAITNNALERMLFWWNNIPEQERASFTGIVTLCQFVNGSICGNFFKTNPLDTDALTLRYKYKKRGETWGFHRTQVLKKYPFPADTLVRFVPENIVWDAIAKSYKIRCVNEPLRIFYQDSGNQITKSSIQKKAAVRAYFLEMINRDIDFFFDDPVTFIKWSLLYVRYSFIAADRAFMRMSKFNHFPAYLLCCFALIPGFLIFVLDMLRNETTG